MYDMNKVATQKAINFFCHIPKLLRAGGPFTNVMHYVALHILYLVFVLHGQEETLAIQAVACCMAFSNHLKLLTGLRAMKFRHLKQKQLFSK